MAVRPAASAARPALQGSPEPIAALNRVRICELDHHWSEREPLVDIRTYCPTVALAERVCPFLRLRAADMLNHARALLPEGLNFRVGTALRTLSMQKHGWDGYFQRMREEHPAWPLSALRRATNKYFAPYDQKAPPGHCTGGAVDVVLVDAAGFPLDVTSPTTGWDAAYTWSGKLSKEARANRMLMVEAMLAAGFSNCRDEYWHYSFGDSAWAVRVGEMECPYGWAHSPACLETDFSGAAAQSCAIETERDFDGRALQAGGRFQAPVPGAGEEERWSVGVYWAKGVPVTLEIQRAAHTQVQAVFAGSAPDKLEPAGVAEPGASGLTLRVVPEADRWFVSSAPGAQSE